VKAQAGGSSPFIPFVFFVFFVFFVPFVRCGESEWAGSSGLAHRPAWGVVYFAYSHKRKIPLERQG
jgi:hypothetical protein